MRMRLGLLHDPEAQQRMHEREVRAAEEKKKKEGAPTVRTEEEQRKHDERKARDEKTEKEGTKKKDEKPKVKIRPLSDARAIELGANFFSEAFIFGVAVALLLAENYRSSRKANNRRDEVAERLDGLEAEVERLRHQHDLPELADLNERIRKSKEAKTSWYNPAGWWRRTDPDAAREDDAEGAAQKLERIREGSIPGNVPGASAVAMKGESSREPQREKPPERIDTIKATKKER